MVAQLLVLTIILEKINGVLCPVKFLKAFTYIKAVSFRMEKTRTFAEISTSKQTKNIVTLISV